MPTQQNDLNIGTVGAGRVIPSDVCDQLKCSCVSVWWQMYINWSALSLQTEYLIIGDRCGRGGTCIVGRTQIFVVSQV